MLAWFFRGSGQVLLRNPLFFVILGGSGPHVPPPLPFYFRCDGNTFCKLIFLHYTVYFSKMYYLRFDIDVMQSIIQCEVSAIKLFLSLLYNRLS